MGLPALSLQNINKYMGEDFSLSNINLDLNYGEVHALMGENGSGKSLTIKIISGIFKSDSGSIYLDGKEILPDSVYDAKKLGIHSVLQDVALYPNLTVAENVFADKMPFKNKLLRSLDFDKLYYDCNKLFEKLGIDIDPYTLISNLGFAQKHLIEMVKAYISDAKIIIFDEPSAAFTQVEKEILYHVIHELKSKQKAIFYITHFIDEIEVIADRISIIHQGKLLGTRVVKDITVDEIIHLMTNMVDKKRYPKIDVTFGQTIFSVKDLYFQNILSGINFEIKKGEILGLTGLVGSGRSVLAKCLFGILNPSSGTFFMNGKPITIKCPSDAINAGIAFLPEDRINSSVFGCLNLEDNVSISSLKRFEKNMILDDYILSDVSSAYVEKLSIKPGHSEDIINTYSGGNQQKMAVARWMMSRQKVYILDEPTRGVDIASKTDIYNCMVDMVRKGASILFISSDIDEILGVCDKIMVLNDGKLVCNLNRKEATKENILMYAASKYLDPSQ